MKRKIERLAGPDDDEKQQKKPRVSRFLPAEALRPAVSDADRDASSQDLSFQLLDIDYITTTELLPAELSASDTAGRKVELTVARCKRPVLRLHGVSEKGHSGCAFVHGFRPFFAVPAPRDLLECARRSKGPGGEALACEWFQEALDKALSQGRRWQQSVLDVRLIQKCSFYGWRGEEKVPFFRVTVATPNLVYGYVRALTETGVFVPQINSWKRFKRTFETNVLFVMRFLIDTGILGAGWM